ncbi:hypothetical protein PGB90_002556 [Kerria lacca]
MIAKVTCVVFFLVALTCIVQGNPIPESAAKEKRALVYSTAYHAPIYSHAPVVAPAPVYHAPVVAHAPVAHGATSYSSFTINHPIIAHAPIVAAHAPVYAAHAPIYSSYYH